MSEYSPLSGTIRSKLVRAELEEPCTRKRTGSGGFPGCGAAERLRQRLSRTSPFFAQYSLLQIGASAPAAFVSVVDREPKITPLPAAIPAALRSARRGSAGLVKKELAIATSSFGCYAGQSSGDT